jgi:hypothetical protein
VTSALAGVDTRIKNEVRVASCATVETRFFM